MTDMASYLLTAADEAAIKDRHRPFVCSCGGRRWVVDENSYDPERRERTPGDGLIPCGTCNEGDWGTPEFYPMEPICDHDNDPFPCDAARLLLSFAALEERLKGLAHDGR
jgi:hypothetical protein